VLIRKEDPNPQQIPIKHHIKDEIVCVPHFDLPISSRSEWRDKFKFKFIKEPKGTESIVREGLWGSRIKYSDARDFRDIVWMFFTNFLRHNHSK
jgi:hypothetical protein